MVLYNKRSVAKAMPLHASCKRLTRAGSLPQWLEVDLKCSFQPITDQCCSLYHVNNVYTEILFLGT